MTLLGLIVAICVILFALWLIKTYLPAPWQVPLLIAVVLLALAFLAVTFFPGAANMKIR